MSPMHAKNRFLLQRTFCKEHRMIFCFKEHFVRSTQPIKCFLVSWCFIPLQGAHIINNCFLVLWCFMPWQFTTPRGMIGFIVSGTFIKRTTLTPFQSRSVSGYIYLCLLGGKTLKFSTSRPGIRTLARHLRSLGLLVNFYPFPTNTLESIHPNIWRYIVLIADTLIISIPHAAVAREYESIWYANSFSSSNSSSNNSHANPMS